MSILEIIGYIALGFIPTLVFGEVAWRNIRRNTEKVKKNKVAQN